MSHSSPLVTLDDLAEAVALLTRLPLRAGFTRGARAAWAWPLAGALVGLIGAAAGATAQAFGLPPPLVAGLALAAMILTTGALHEDGLADVADGFWGGHETRRRLEIMKDSRIGSYGVLALGIVLGLRWLALSALIAAGELTATLLVAGLVSRAPMAVLMAALPNARGAGLAASVGRPAPGTAALAVTLATGLALVLAGSAGLAALFWAALASIGVAALARAKIGGQTGDVLGASQQIAEVAVLLALVASL